MMSAFRRLAMLKVLRGAPLDVFGRTEEIANVAAAQERREKLLAAFRTPPAPHVVAAE